MTSIIYGFIMASGFILACVYVRLGSVLWELQRLNDTIKDWDIEIR